jgi:hypothetical protein
MTFMYLASLAFVCFAFGFVVAAILSETRR